MKKQLLMLAMLVSLNVNAYESKNKCEEIIFKGQSKDHLKEVVACKTKNGFISYSEGTISEKNPDLDILIPVQQVTWDNIFKENISLYALNFNYEKDKYSLILGYERDGVGAIAGVYVTSEESEDKSKDIQLDPESVEENIVPSLSEFGIEQYTK